MVISAFADDTKKETFMKMVELHAEPGMGVKKFSLVFVFEYDKVLNTFINSGWEFGGQANASATTRTKGGQMSGATERLLDLYIPAP